MPKFTKARKAAFKAAASQSIGKTGFGSNELRGQSSDAEGNEKQPLSRGQKKRLERKDRIMQKIGLKQVVLKSKIKKVAAGLKSDAHRTTSSSATSSSKTATTKPTKKQRHQKKTTNEDVDMDENSDSGDNIDSDGEDMDTSGTSALIDVSHTTQPQTNQSKKQLIVSEVARVQQVQSHASFKENPLFAIQQHLQAITGKSVPEIKR